MDEAAVHQRLLFREENKALAVQKSRRVRIETAPIPEEGIEGYKILAFPFIPGLNLEPTATGFADTVVSSSGHRAHEKQQYFPPKSQIRHEHHGRDLLWFDFSEGHRHTLHVG